MHLNSAGAPDFKRVIIAFICTVWSAASSNRTTGQFIGIFPPNLCHLLSKKKRKEKWPIGIAWKVIHFTPDGFALFPALCTHLLSGQPLVHHYHQINISVGERSKIIGVCVSKERK